MKHCDLLSAKIMKEKKIIYFCKNILNPLMN